MKKILIVDDSLVYRHSLTSALSDDKSISVVGAVKNGQEALDFILKNQVDLITLDIEMPVMNGHELIKKMSPFPTRPKIIVFTSLDSSGAGNALDALRLGADDFVTKIEGDGNITKSIEEVKTILIPKIKSLLKIHDGTAAGQVYPLELKNKNLEIGPRTSRRLKTSYDYICIGTSTGGPEALRFIFNNLHGKKMPPIFIVQHMPPMYTTYLAKSLNENTSYEVSEAHQGDIVKAGKCYLAPGDYHMSLVTNKNTVNKIALNQEEKECFVRPSVNYLFRSAEALSGSCLFVVLTGMGSDGLSGIEFLTKKDYQPDVLIQDEKSCAVWGMPGEIFHKQTYTEMRSLEEIKDILSKII